MQIITIYDGDQRLGCVEATSLREAMEKIRPKIDERRVAEGKIRVARIVTWVESAPWPREPKSPRTGPNRR